MGKGYTNANHQVPMDKYELIGAAMSGDIIFQVNPATVNKAIAQQNDAAGTREVEVLLVDSKGRVHDWFTGTITVSVSEVTAGNGALAITGGDTTPAMVNGRCIVELEYSGAWAAGVAQVEDATVVGTITLTGTATVIVTSAGMAGSPITLNVDVVGDDSATVVAGKIRAALNANAVIAAKFTIAGTGAVVKLTAKVTAANDATANVDINNGTCTGLTDAPTSANTTAGVAKDINTLTVAQQTISGATVVTKASVETSI